MINREKRRRVIARSIHLGHCICNPRLSCPCDLLRSHDVCPCAGERMPEAAEAVKLTQLVEKAGCASKIDQSTLRRLIRQLPIQNDPRVLVGAAAGDDAGVFRHDPAGPAWVQTVDVFTPPVDDPYTFGQIAAANSLSDIYAMGAAAMTALSLVSFPTGELPESALLEILRGGLDKMNEAGVSVIGGHSINESQVKAGFAVTGIVDPARVAANSGARPGDLLILTKPLGTGVVSFATQIGRASAESVAAAARSMSALNKAASQLMQACAAHACTDVTGFGLAGHLSAMAAASNVDVEVFLESLPILPGVPELLDAGVLPGAMERNRESAGDAILAEADVPPNRLEIVFDAQTSGGLLIAVAEEDGPRLLSRLQGAGVESAALIGRVLGPGTGLIHVRSRPPAAAVPREVSVAAPPPVPEMSNQKEPSMSPEPDHVPCCADAAQPAGATDDAGQQFQQFLAAVNRPGALDAYTKQAIALALALLSRCEPCLKMHLKKAREKGFTQAEIDEAAWMAISFGGAPLMVLYNAARNA